MEEVRPSRETEMAVAESGARCRAQAGGTGGLPKESKQKAAERMQGLIRK